MSGWSSGDPDPDLPDYGTTIEEIVKAALQNFQRLRIEDPQFFQKLQNADIGDSELQERLKALGLPAISPAHETYDQRLQRLRAHCSELEAENATQLSQPAAILEPMVKKYFCLPHLRLLKDLNPGVDERTYYYETCRVLGGGELTMYVARYASRSSLRIIAAHNIAGTFAPWACSSSVMKSPHGCIEAVLTLS